MSHKKDAKLIWVNQIRYVRRERLSFRSKEYTEELKVYSVQVFWTRLASFDQLGLICEPVQWFQSSTMESMILKDKEL